MDEIRELSTAGDPYFWLCSTLIPCVVGWKVWNRRYKKETISDIATCSDEAFVILTLENNYDRWMAEATWLARNKDKDDPMDQEEKNFPDSRFTNSGRSKQNGRSKRLQGWAREGYLLFNALYEQVKEDRKRRANFKSELLAQLRRNNDDYNSDVDDADEVCEEDIFPANDL